MEIRKFRTLIKVDHRFDHSEFSDLDIERNGFGEVIVTVEGTEDQYKTFKKLIERLYPEIHKICEFDYKTN